MKFYIQQKNEIHKFLKTFFKTNSKRYSKNYLWANDAIKRLEEFVLPGKMIRGSLVVLGANAKSKQEIVDAVKIGSALELLHSGILIHDDIMDQDLKRRGKPTIFAQYMSYAKEHDLVDERRYGESMGACVGIIAYFFAIEIISSISNKKVIPELLALFGSEMAALGMAQMQDVDGGYHRVQFQESDIQKLYEQKTGRYTFTLPLLAGLTLSNVKSKSQTKTDQIFNKLGKELGVVFQLQDDILSLVGSPKLTGKPLASDIRERKQTLLYLKLVQTVTIAEKKKVLDIYSQKKVSENDVKFVLGLVEKYKIIEWAQGLVLKHRSNSLKLTDKISSNKFMKEQLHVLLEFLVDRKK